MEQELQEEFRNLYESQGRSVTNAFRLSTLQEYKVFLKCIEELFLLVEVEETNQLYIHINSDEIIEWIIARHKENNLDKSFSFMAPDDIIIQLPSHIQQVCYAIFEEDKLKKSYAIFQSQEKLLENIIHQKIGELLQIDLDQQKNIQIINEESLKFLNERCQGYFKLVGYFQNSKKYIFKFESDFSNKESLPKLTEDILNEVLQRQDKSESNSEQYE
ncbi:hypothetical protein TTHERM_00637830 (macronuclear) [Tetrahymena thermophila SB210]|uniref:Uncharacterized protein n=1 Tax=Tetrahymena thermophila (strain SB210) TaxID=312017 RepID=Q22HC0_TETTS|nr:hypothetical protein TTHERM_00637830 [Tetrahymena thermophila SB210]EAR84781.2 hypothetical protein TTHERM_00637830 [Tetrahymena thermophila SB210]|eukprot:XP_001032444.2 hypothetical protein TTHERM_00637830 [Tetrahymena thermophila SB210]